ncbi:DNA damage response protein RcaA [Purpureocillium lavendulum]|uniref:DNA damage response protein RcaA n=1 Tax=Purpureocillium lavendulum TaxID=1247861 RepID=A0AB34FTH8_9HYPO|nr:DNA damage response protein RcaA [Purpureocillium lavendulum]
MGRRLWLRPGKTYLFGRTAAEPGQLAISHNTISRKHLTITVDNVPDGHAHHLTGRSKLTIEDLKTKIGTTVDGHKIKGSQYVVEGKQAELVMGKCPQVFRQVQGQPSSITWFPVVFTFSFTNKELQTQPLDSLREQFESLDIKLLTDYNVDFTTHVVAKKRNTAKGLQALINGKFIVTETFLDAVTQAAEPPQDGDVSEPSALEQDFSRYWPDAMQHLPPRGGEPVQHPDSIYAPDLGRKDVFEGYTFIFYDKTQYNNLLAPITNGGGKAMLHTITPGEEQVDDFVRYVKGVAGEKGLGSFDDGSEGKGVVLVRYLPGKGDLVDWYTQFITDVSLRLDHRPIEQNEFLEAILVKDASKLRRPLEVESSMPSQGANARPTQQEPAVERPSSSAAHGPSNDGSQPTDDQADQPAPRRGRTRGPIKRRFAGFDDDADMDVDEPSSVRPAAGQPQREDDEGGLFVSQEGYNSQSQHDSGTQPSSRKRRASPLPEDDLMDGMAPAVARFKRQRLEHADAFASASPEPAPAKDTAVATSRAKKAKDPIDILALAARNREEEEARARREKEDLANMPDDVDLAEIRRLQIVEEMPVRQSAAGAAAGRDQDIASGRWDPKWNGMKNFKKFRRRGEEQGRQPARVIVPLSQVKNKEFGVGDNYWLDDEGSQRKKTTQPSLATASHPSASTGTPSMPAPSTVPSQRKRNTGFIVSDSSDAEDDNGAGETGDNGTAPGATASSRVAATQSQRNTRSQGTTQSQGKRPAREPPATAQQPAKRPRAAAASSSSRRAAEIPDSDSDDELKFRFGRRR